MPKKRDKPEEIIAKLRKVDVLASQGTSIVDAVRQIGVTEMASLPSRGIGFAAIVRGAGGLYRNAECGRLVL